MPELIDAALACFGALGWPAVQNRETGVIQSVYAMGTSEMNLYLHVSQEHRQFVFHNSLPAHVPPESIPAVHEFVTRANFELQFGAFQLNLDHGGLRFVTSLTLGDADFDARLLHPVLMGNVVTMFRFAPALQALIANEQGLAEALAMAGVESPRSR